MKLALLKTLFTGFKTIGPTIKHIFTGQYNHKRAVMMVLFLAMLIFAAWLIGPENLPFLVEALDEVSDAVED